ncbi:MAG: hypothetical protein ACREAR_01975 [Nitrosotalea sp.]
MVVSLAKSNGIIMAILFAIILTNPQLVLAAEPINHNPIPLHAEKMRISLAETISAHPNWVYMMSWNSTSSTVDYLGPAGSNPHIVHGVYMAPTGVIDKGISTNADATNGGMASEWKEVSDFTNQKITSSSTDLFQILDALNSNSAHWLQVGVLYDNANLINPTPSWRVAYNSFSTSTCSSTGEWFVTSLPQTMNPGDSVESYVYVDTSQAGHYVMGETDSTANTGTLYGFGISGDAGSTINLGEVDVGACHYSAGPEQEEQSNGSTIPVAFGDEHYAMGYYDTSSSSRTNSVFSWNSPWGTSCITLNPSPPPTNPADITFHYGC